MKTTEMSQRRSQTVKQSSIELKRKPHEYMRRFPRKSLDHCCSCAYKMQFPPPATTSSKDKIDAFPAKSHLQCKHCVKENKFQDQFQQPRRTMNVFPTKYKVQTVKMEFSRKQQATDNSAFFNGREVVCKSANPDPSQHSYIDAQHGSVWTPRDKAAKLSLSVSQHGSDSLERLLLDFESIRLMKEEVNEDNASDLSDSERIPIPPSPLTPPDLNLRAEQIDAECFNQHSDMEGECYSYPDLLPAPFNTWNLSQLAIFVNTEGTHTLRPTASDSLDKYIERLLQLEWLQMQTTLNEKSKVAKPRPQTAHGISHNGKATTKSKSWYNPWHNKQITRSDNLSKTASHQENNDYRTFSLREAEAHSCSLRSCTKVCENKDVLCSVRKHAQEVRSVTKKRATLSCRQATELPPFESNPKIQTMGNMRPPKQSSFFHDSESRLKLAKANTQSNVRRNTDVPISHVAAKQFADKKAKSGSAKTPSCKLKK